MSVTRKFAKAARVLASSDKRWFHALRHGVAPSLEHLRVLGLMCPEVVVDIGANRGQFALAVRHVYPEARIESFEPLPTPARLCREVFQGDTRFALHEFAVAPHGGTADIHVSAHDDSSSLLPIGDLQDRLFPGTAEVGRRTIKLCRLEDELSDDVFGPPALLKLDVQGFEAQALTGCESLLGRFTWIYVECSFVELYEGQALADQVIAWLRERGFELAGIYNMAYATDGSAVQADFLFRHQSVNMQKHVVAPKMSSPLA